MAYDHNGKYVPDYTTTVDIHDCEAFLRGHLERGLAEMRPLLVVSQCIHDHIAAGKRVDKRIGDKCLAAFNAAGYEGQVWYVKPHHNFGRASVCVRLKGSNDYRSVSVTEGERFAEWAAGYADSPVGLAKCIRKYETALADDSIGRIVAQISAIRTMRDTLDAMLDGHPAGSHVAEHREWYSR